MRDEIMFDLVDNAKDYELEGVEFTQEDADYVEGLIKNGTPYDVAIEECLNGIYEVLNN